MSENKTLDAYIEMKSKKSSDTFFTTDSINYISTQGDEQGIKADFERIIRHTTMSMKNLANAYYKTGTYLESSDIEQIKTSLNEYAKDDLKICQFKVSLIEDLTKIQTNIQTKFYEKLANLNAEKVFCQKQVRIIEFAKNKLIMDRLSKVQWPYDAQTQEYDNKLAGLKIKIENYERKIEELKNKRPSADEKDILIYQMQLKEKYIAR